MARTSPLNFDLPSSTPGDYDQDLFESPFTFQDTAWNRQPLFDSDELAFGTLPNPAREQADLYQTFVNSPNLLLPSYSEFAGLTNAYHASHAQLLPQNVTETAVESGDRGQDIQDFDDGEDIAAASVAERHAEGKRTHARNLDWDAHQETLRRLYLEEDKTLDEVKETMRRDHGFDPTSRQYKNRFAMWRWQKKLPGDVAVWMSTKRQKRKRENGKDTTFSWRGIEWKMPKIESSAARASKQFVQDGHRMTTPVGVDYWTPRMANRSPLIAVPFTANSRPEFVPAPAIEPGPRASISETAYTNVQPRQLLLAWNGRPKSELENVYRTARAAHHRRETHLAEGLYSQALEGYRNILGPIEAETIRVVHTFASFHLEQGNDTKAYDLLEHSVQAHVTQLGEDSNQTLHYALDVANLLSGCNREDDAIAFLRSAHGLLNSSKARSKAREGSSTGKISLPSIGELLAAAEAATRSSDPPSLEFGMSVARNASKAGEPAAEAILLAIISHCEYDPEKLAGQRLKAWADIIDLYRSRDEFNRNPANYNSTIHKAEGAFNATMEIRPWRQADAKDFNVLKACLKLAKSFLAIDEHRRADRMFNRISGMTERLFGLGEHAIAILIEIGQLYQDKNGWSSSRLWFEHALANAIQELPEKDGVRVALEAAKARGHFSYCDDEGEPYQTVFGVSGVIIRPTRMCLSL